MNFALSISEFFSVCLSSTAKPLKSASAPPSWSGHQLPVLNSPPLHLTCILPIEIARNREKRRASRRASDLPVRGPHGRQTCQGALAGLFLLAVTSQLQINLAVDMHQPVHVALRLIVPILQ